MTVNVTIKPELEARLVARAQSAGQSLEIFIHRVLEREVTPTKAANGSKPLTGPEKAKAFRAWAKNFPTTNAPALSLDAVSRENIYQRD